MAKHEDLTGLKFGKLTTVSYAGNNCRRQAQWNVTCECGGTAIVLANKLKRGVSRSCGCEAANLSPEMVGIRFGRLTVLDQGGSDLPEQSSGDANATAAPPPQHREDDDSNAVEAGGVD